MNIEDIKKYVGQKVLIILKNNYKFTTIIPEFNGTSFQIVDKFGQKVMIECDMVSMIYEKESENATK